MGAQSLVLAPGGLEEMADPGLRPSGSTGVSEDIHRQLETADPHRAPGPGAQVLVNRECTARASAQK